VKTARIWLLLVLAVLLPLRGALAAGMLCPVADAHGPVQAHAGPHAHHQHAASTAHDHAPPHMQSDAHDAHHAAGEGKCNSCSAFCSVPAVTSAPLAIASVEPARAGFAGPTALPASFIPDGRDRPPRSI
jgi:hypothetical protein